jgi:hypothetical protein
MSTVDSGYLAAARAAGQLYEIDGLFYVAGSYVEPVTGEKQCLVEYADAALLAEPELGRLIARLTDDFPQARRLVLRAPPQVALPAPWAPQLTYISYQGTPGAPDPAIVPARARDRDRLIDWLMRAFADAGSAFGGQAAAQSLHRLAEEVMASPGRQSLVYLAGETAVGHATLLCEAGDAVTGERFVELLDILVEPDHDVRAITRELVTVAALRAAELGKRLVGNVVHAAHGGGNGDRVVASLLTSGWAVAFRYWQRGTGPEQD